MAYFKCKGEAGENTEYLYKWDFTKSLTDEIQGVTASLTNATLTQGVGVVTDTYNGIVKLVSITQNIIDKTIELDFTDLELTPTPQSVYVAAMLLGRGGNYKFAYGFTSGVEKWLTYNINNTALSYNSTSNQIVFNNGVNFKFVFTSENLKVYLNGELFFDGEPFTGGTNVTMLTVGTYHQLIDGFKFTLTGARIYNNKYLYNWDFTKSLTDEVRGITATLVDGAVFTQGTGVSVSDGAGLLRVVFDTPIIFGDYVFEIDFANTNYNTDSNGIMFRINRSEYRYSTGIRWFGNTVWTTVINGTAGGQTMQCNDANIFSGKTMKFLNENDSLHIFANNSLVSENTKFCDDNKSINDFEVGSGYYNFTITGIRIYTKSTAL